MSPDPAQVNATDFLAVVGTADLESFTASLENVYLLSQENTIALPDPGDWAIVLVGDANNDLATYPFAPDELTDGEESPGTPAVIAEVVPWVAGAVTVEIRYKGQVVDSRSVSANAPVVTLNTPADGSQLPAGPFQVSWDGSDQDGDPLSYSLLYSNDNGVNWQTLAANMTDSNVELNSDQLPGGTGQLRIIASDGFLTGQDTNTGLGIPLHAPTAEIQTPNSDEVFFPTQQVVFQGSAYDLEDGTLGDAAFSWSSNIDGFLGTGASLSTTELTTGIHVITLTATDSHNMTSQVQRTIEVAEESALEPLSLQVSPFGIVVVAALNSPPVQEPLSVRSMSDTEIDWTVSEDIPWLSVDQSGGPTPADLVITFDPTGLPVGQHSGVITFTSPQAANSPLEVAVTLQITGFAQYLPSIIR
jgi:hypothetical protein